MHALQGFDGGTVGKASLRVGMLAEGLRRSRLQGDSMFGAHLESLGKVPGCFSAYPALARLLVRDAVIRTRPRL